MNGFLNAIQHVTGPLTFLAFITIIFLAVYRRSVKDEKGLEYIYNLFQEKLTRDQFYALASQIINRLFWGILLIFVFSLITFVIVKLGLENTIEVNRSEGNSIEKTIDANKLGGNIINSGDQSVIVTGGGDANVNMGGQQRGDTIISQGEGNTLIGEEPGTVIVSSQTPSGARARIANPLARIGDKERLSENYRIDIAPKGQGSDGFRIQYDLKNVCDVDKRLCSNLSMNCDGYVELCPVYEQGCIDKLQLDGRFYMAIKALGEDPESFCLDYRQTCSNSAQQCKNLTIPPLPPSVFGFHVPWVIDKIDLWRTDTWEASPFSNALQEVHHRPNGVLALVGFVTEDQATSLADKQRTDPLDLILYPIPHGLATHAVSIPLARITHFIHGRIDFAGPSANEITVL